MENLAVLWDASVSDTEGDPFDKEGVEEAYQFFSKEAESRDLQLYLANYKWYKGGELEKAYVLEDGKWRVETDVAVDIVFDKFVFNEETKKLKKQIDREKEILNSPELEEICKDKLLSFKRFPELVPETGNAERSRVKRFLEEDGKAVLKPRFDWGGQGVKVIESLEGFEGGEELVQRFIDSSSGIEELGIEGVHDLRFLVLNGEVQRVLLRTPDEGFISNVNRGGSLQKVEAGKVPERAFEVVEKVDHELKSVGDRFYSVDLIFDENGRPWVLELNSKPALAFWNDEEIAEWKKPVIRQLVRVLSG
ncbi:MAG: RimK family alpha-L-glutamate ligase [Candidatus Nanohaloarchaea archaeon]